MARTGSSRRLARTRTRTRDHAHDRKTSHASGQAQAQAQVQGAISQASKKRGAKARNRHRDEMSRQRLDEIVQRERNEESSGAVEPSEKATSSKKTFKRRGPDAVPLDMLGGMSI
ncbi:hypothetical protein IE81DRAFT_350190 [Ceraceosorus guamensis]|uniref:Uncharacterized protein n=1 Tax=Ceraceosorus guamensis TaxID=1522189 RepID=A0A316VVD6_9BASI|nr:hypothetical protein IE81DRAFT_350190 [Ceraceosorus guamensis]PWN39405.1 hypothetical protein IE81DRAFT_350190 [Ceraceosorus guamensis]